MAPTRDGADSWRWYPPSRPLAAEGIKARSRKGDIGATWWSQRFIALLESFQMGTRLTRGRRYARAGQVLELDIGPGRVASRVQGSRPKPYTVTIAALPIPAKDWARIEEALAARAVFLAKLLAGEMPTDIEDAFVACGLSLFPSRRGDLATDCSCPDWANPCKHVAATYYLLAEAFDDDPFLIFAWRGRARDDLLACLGMGQPGPAATGGPSGWVAPVVAAPALDDCLEDWYTAGPALSAARSDRPRPLAVLPDALLRELDDPPVEVGSRSLAEVLRPAYAAIVDAVETAPGPDTEEVSVPGNVPLRVSGRRPPGNPGGRRAAG